MSTQDILCKLYEEVFGKLKKTDGPLGMEQFFKKVNREIQQDIQQSIKGCCPHCQAGKEELEDYLQQTEKEDAQRDENTYQIAFVPVVESCVVAMMRQLFDWADAGETEFANEDLDRIWGAHFFDYRRLGLNQEEGEVVRNTAMQAVKESTVFNFPIQMERDEKVYKIFRHKGIFCVQIIE